MPIWSFSNSIVVPEELSGRRVPQLVNQLVLLFTSLLAIPLARQSCLDATLLTGLQIVGVTLHLFDNVLLLYLPLEPAQRIFERLAFLYANLCQKNPTSKPAKGLFNDTGILERRVNRNAIIRLKVAVSRSELAPGRVC